MGLFSLIFKIGTDNTDFNRGMEHAVDRSKRASRQMADDFSKVARNRLGQAGEMLGGFIGASAVKDMIDFGGRMQDMSERTGVAAERLQEIDYALKLSGSSAERAEKAMRALGQAREKALANPAGKEAAEFSGLGIKLDELKNLRDAGDLFLRFGTAIERVKLDAASLPAILDLIGTKNAEILPAMASGLRESAMEARRLGLILSDETIASLDQLGDEITTVLTAIKKPFAEVILFFARAVDAGIQAVRAAGAAGVNYMNNFMQMNLLLPKFLKKQAQEITNEVNAEFGKGFNEFLDRNDPDKIAAQRAAKRDRAAKVRDFDQDALLDALKAGKEGKAASAGKGLERLRTDSLLSVGNFLGSGPDRTAQELRQQTQTLQRIQQLIEQQGRTNTIRFD